MLLLAPHVVSKSLLDYENALALKAAVLLRTDSAGAYVLEIHNRKSLGQLQTMLAHWERSGTCTAWWVEN